MLQSLYYDTYLTSNTEEKFEEFRKTNPIDAAEIEPPTNQADFELLVDALSNNYEPKNLLETMFPELIDVASNMEREHSESNRLVFSTNVKRDKFYLYLTKKADNGIYLGGRIITNDQIILDGGESLIGVKTNLEENIA